TSEEALNESSGLFYVRNLRKAGRQAGCPARPASLKPPGRDKTAREKAGWNAAPGVMYLRP
ncbi:hypothetical protein, partial [Pantoea allii]|uniref:hypothetical protein n=1 Tax=Pantoea allii TaxID=574096 RepID=UPI003D316B60